MVCFFGRVPGTWYERLVVFFHQILCPLPPPLFRGCVPALWYKCDPIDLYKVATAYAFLALSVVLVLAVVAILLKVFGECASPVSVFLPQRLLSLTVSF